MIWTDIELLLEQVDSQLSIERFRQVDNATDQGAIMMLPFHRARMNALELSERIKYCELAAAMLIFRKMCKYSILFSNY